MEAAAHHAAIHQSNLTMDSLFCNMLSSVLNGRELINTALGGSFLYFKDIPSNASLCIIDISIALKYVIIPSALFQAPHSSNFTIAWSNLGSSGLVDRYMEFTPNNGSDRYNIETNNSETPYINFYFLPDKKEDYGLIHSLLLLAHNDAVDIDAV